MGRHLVRRTAGLGRDRALVAARGGALTGAEAAELLLSGQTQIPVGQLTDYALNPAGVTLCQIRLP